jgi:hypothetical protein
MELFRFRLELPCLASTYADRVITLSNDWVSMLGHHTQISVLQLEMHPLARARFEMDTLESTPACFVAVSWNQLCLIPRD